MPKVIGIEKVISELHSWDFPRDYGISQEPSRQTAELLTSLTYEIQAQVWSMATIEGASTILNELSDTRHIHGDLDFDDDGLQFTVLMLEWVKIIFPITAKDIRANYDGDALKSITSRLRALADEIDG